MFDDILDSLFQQTRSPARRRRGGTGLDKLQAAGDAAGVADQSGLVDLTNAAVSAVRAMRSKDPQERKEHWKDAGIRAVSAIPVIGDLAKLGRLGKYAELAKGARSGSRSGASLSGARSGAVGAGAAIGGRQAQGLTASELMGMAGKTRDQIELADKEKRSKEESVIKQEEANAAAGELKESIKKLAGGGLSAGIALAGMPHIVQKWGAALVESQRHLARYDGRLAMAYARLDIDRTFRDMQTARATGGSSAEVARQLSVLEDSLQQLKQLGATVTNIAALMATGSATVIAEAMNTMLTPIFLMARAAEKFLGQREASMPLHQAVQDMLAQGDFQKPPPAPLPPL